MHATICDMILDLTQNAMEANAQCIQLSVREGAERLVVEIQDDGCGMSPAVLRRARDPFYTDGVKHTHRKVGLGLPFLFQTAEAVGGDVELESEEGRGTRVAFSMPTDAVDLPPFGDFAATALLLFSGAYEGELKLFRDRNGRAYQVGRRELEKTLGNLNALENLELLKLFFKNNEEELLQAGV